MMSSESISNVQQMKKLNNIRIFNFEFQDSTTKKIKRDLNRRSPIIIRRQRATVENHSPDTQIKTFQTCKSISKHSQSFRVPIWTPKLNDFQQAPLKVNRSRSFAIKPRCQQMCSNEKKCSSANRELFISPRILNQNIETIKKANFDDYDDEVKSNVAVSSDEEEEDSAVTTCNAPRLTLNDQFSSPTFIPNHQRRILNNNFYLPPVFEEINDEKY